VSVGDSVIIFSFAFITPEEAKTQKAKVVIVGEENTVGKVIET